MQDIHSKSRIFRLIFFLLLLFSFYDINVFLCRFELVYFLLEAVSDGK